jgi:HPt (histidine-containing phosphotransfer) domain-containing protein
VNEEHASVDIEIPAIRGFDVDEGLLRVGGNKKLYRELVVKFSQQFSKTGEEIRESLEKEDLATAQRLAHTVKGAAGNLGATEMNEKAAALDAAFKKGKSEEYEVLLADFERTLKALSEAIDNTDLQFPVKKPAATGPEIKKKELIGLLKQLEPLLKKRQPKVCAPIIEKIMSHSLPVDSGGDIEMLSGYIKKYKFKDAMQMLAAILSRLNTEI